MAQLRQQQPSYLRQYNKQHDFSAGITKSVGLERGPPYVIPPCLAKKNALLQRARQDARMILRFHCPIGAS